MTYFLYIIMKTMAFIMYTAPFVIVFLATESILLRIIFAIAAVIIVLRGLLGPYTSRVMFCLKIKRICRKAKLKCKCHHILAPFFFKTGGFDIVITDRKADIYSIKFFKGNVNEKGIHLRSVTQVETIRYLVAPKLGRRHAMGRVERTERSRKISSYEMPIAPYGNSILLFSPSPYQMTALFGNKLLPIGNGEAFGEFHIYTARGFTDYMKRKHL